MDSCATCRWWVRGETYITAKYGHIPQRIGWSQVQTGEYLIQHGECRIVAPFRCGGSFVVTYEFQGCGDHQPKDPRP